MSYRHSPTFKRTQPKPPYSGHAHLLLTKNQISESEYRAICAGTAIISKSTKGEPLFENLSASDLTVEVGKTVLLYRDRALVNAQDIILGQPGKNEKFYE
jgi:hypothetical protein